MCPLPYDPVRRDSKDPRQLRYRLVLHAAEHGLKPTARDFHCTPQRVRKWVRRWQADGWAGLVERSRAPRNPVRQISAAQRQQAIRVKQQCPAFGAQCESHPPNLARRGAAESQAAQAQDQTEPPRREGEDARGAAVLRGYQGLGRHSRALAANPALQPATGPIHRPRGRQRAAVCRLRPRAQSLLCHALHRTPPGTPAGVREALGRRVHSDRQWVEFIGSWNARADSVFTQAVCHVPGLTHCAVPPGARGIRGGRRTRMTCRTVPRRGSRTWMTEQWKTDPGTHRPCGH